MNQRFCNGMIHVIKPGENLYQLSRKYRVPLALILRANPYVDVYNLQPGQEICIPMSKPIMPFPGMRPSMPKENTMENMPKESEESMMEEEEEERISEEKPEESMMDKMEEDREPEELISVYITEEMDSLADILDKSGMTMEELLENNPLDKFILLPGRELKVIKKV